MDEPYKTIEYKGKTISLYTDDDPQDPREWDNMGTMVCFHRDYKLGDKHDYNQDNYNSWNELRNAIIKNEDTAVILPLRLYDHSGITISVLNNYPYNDAWDSMCVGFIFVSKEKIREEYQTKRISKKILERAKKALMQEVETYDDYLTGYVCGYDTGNDSCWGYYGTEGEKQAIEEAKQAIEYELKEEEKKREAKTKAYIKNSVPLCYRVT